MDRLLDEQSWSSLKETFKAGTATGEMRGMIITLSLKTFSTEFRCDDHPHGLPHLRHKVKEAVRKDNVLSQILLWLL